MSYRQTSNISRTLVGNEIVDHSDAVGASPAPKVPLQLYLHSRPNTWHLEWVKTTTRRDEKHFNFGIRCDLYQRFDGAVVYVHIIVNRNFHIHPSRPVNYHIRTHGFVNIHRIFSDKCTQFVTVTPQWATWRTPTVYPTACSWAHGKKHQSSALLAFVRGIHRWPLESPHKGQ